MKKKKIFKFQIDYHWSYDMCQNCKCEHNTMSAVTLTVQRQTTSTSTMISKRAEKNAHQTVDSLTTNSNT